MPCRKTLSRKALTLIELLVVIAILLVVAALAAAFMPRIQDRQNISRGTDLLSQWLLTAKQRARRDGLVTGLRFTTAANSPNLSATQFSAAVHVQQPEPIAGGLAPSTAAFDPTTSGQMAAATAGATTVSFTGVDFSNGQGANITDQSLFVVQVGDYLEVRNSAVHNITGVSPSSLTLASGVAGGPATFNYRILRMPRALAGEPVLEMPGTVVVDLTSGFSQNVPQRIIANAASQSGQVVNEVLFAPDGSVVGPGVSSGTIILWVRDSTNADLNLGGLVAVQVRTGFIATYDIFPIAVPQPATPPSSAFQFVLQGQDSGL